MRGRSAHAEQRGRRNRPGEKVGDENRRGCNRVAAAGTTARGDAARPAAPARFMSLAHEARRYRVDASTSPARARLCPRRRRHYMMIYLRRDVRLGRALAQAGMLPRNGRE